MVKTAKSDSSSSDLDETPVPQKQWKPTQVFLSGLPYETNEDSIREFFKDHAEAIG